jgi:hypothetical protein
VNEYMKNNIAVIIIVALLVGGGIGFFGGMQYQKSQRGAGFGQFANGGFGPRGGSGAGGARFRNGGGVVGDILSVDNNSMTVKLADGSSKIVLLTGSTTINKAAQATVADLTAGTRVAAFGATNSDGSVTATNVQINPLMRGPNGSSGSSGAQGL